MRTDAHISNVIADERSVSTWSLMLIFEVSQTNPVEKYG